MFRQKTRKRRAKQGKNLTNLNHNVKRINMPKMCFPPRDFQRRTQQNFPPDFSHSKRISRCLIPTKSGKYEIGAWMENEVPAPTKPMQRCVWLKDGRKVSRNGENCCAGAIRLLELTLVGRKAPFEGNFNYWLELKRYSGWAAGCTRVQGRNNLRNIEWKLFGIGVVCFSLHPKSPSLPW